MRGPSLQPAVGNPSRTASDASPKFGGGAVRAEAVNRQDDDFPYW